jgi:hypothetical protein
MSGIPYFYSDSCSQGSFGTLLPAFGTLFLRQPRVLKYNVKLSMPYSIAQPAMACRVVEI